MDPFKATLAKTAGCGTRLYPLATQTAVGTSGLLQRAPAAGNRAGSAIATRCPSTVPTNTIPLMLVGGPRRYVVPSDPELGTSISHRRRFAAAAHTLKACRRP